MSFPVRIWFKFLCLSVGVLLLLAGNAKRSVAEKQEKDKTTIVKVVRFGKLWDGKGKVWTNANVVIEGDHVKEVTAHSKEIPAGAELIDLSKYYGLPGLIDVHTHLTYLPPDNTNPSSQLLLPGEVVFLSQQNARKTLEAGVTTVRDLGAADQNDVALRNLINRGSVLGPRMFVAGCGLYVTGDPWRPTGLEPDCGRADGKVEVERAIRQHVASGVDVIKMYGSTGSGDDVTGYQTFTLEELQTAVEVAHKYGKKVAVHSYRPDGAHDAVQAGADSIEHATDMDDATIKQWSHEARSMCRRLTTIATTWMRRKN
jgi:imidazolonepropionase-like amidohydrolase